MNSLQADVAPFSMTANCQPGWPACSCLLTLESSLPFLSFLSFHFLFGGRRDEGQKAERRDKEDKRRRKQLHKTVLDFWGGGEMVIKNHSIMSYSSSIHLKGDNSRDEDGSLFLQLTNFKLKDVTYILRLHMSQLNKNSLFLLVDKFLILISRGTAHTQKNSKFLEGKHF